MKLSIILPAFNEEKRLPLTLAAILGYLTPQPFSWELIVVDDGSKDRTAEVGREWIVKIPHLKVIRHEINRGKGHAVREGVMNSDGQFVGFLDADYKIPVEEVDKIWPWFEEEYDVVIGSRDLNPSLVEVPQPIHRRIGSRGFSWIKSALVGLPHVPDTQCGFKFFKRHVALDLFGRSKVDGPMFDIELMCLTVQLGYRLKQVPVRFQHDADSRFRLFHTTWRSIKEVWWIRRHVMNIKI